MGKLKELEVSFDGVALIGEKRKRSLYQLSCRLESAGSENKNIVKEMGARTYENVKQ